MNDFITSLDMRIIDDVLEMGGGYVLDFSDRTFRNFFADHQIDIDADWFKSDGTSKANRLRCFLRQTPPPVSGKILAELFHHRELMRGANPVSDAALAAYKALVQRLGGELPNQRPRANLADASEEQILALAFRPEALSVLPLQVGLADLLTERMIEAQRCIGCEAYLAAVVIAGSVLEGLCLGIGIHNHERVNRVFKECYHKVAPNPQDWKLSQWITVLEKLGDLSPNISKFGHALREFRNYIHPSAQLASKFTPDAHTARISFQVVVAAIDDLSRAHGGQR